MEVKEILKNHKNPVVAFSGGKDSTAVLNLVRSVDPGIPAVFCDTGVEAKTTYEYIKRVDNVITLKPKKTFWKCVEEYGFPQQKNKAKSHGNRCCWYLKEEPMRQYIKKESINLVFTGLTMSESHQRLMFLKHYGDYMYVKTWGVWKHHPISDWDVEKVWDYIKDNDLDYNKGYDNQMKRSGCQPCTAYCTWKQQLAKENFKLYAIIQHKRLQMLVDDYK